MKFNKWTLGLLAAGAILATCPVRAQTNAPVAPTTTGVLATFDGWVTTYNTNYTFSDLLTWDGPVYQSGINVANEIGGSLDLWRQDNATNAASTLFDAAEIRARQGAIAGSFISEAGGDEFGWQKYDLRFGGFADAVYKNGHQSGGRLAGEFGVFADKMFGQNSAAGMFVSLQTGQSSPFIGVNFNLSFGNGKGFLGLF